jgi:hypothetical protein
MLLNKVQCLAPGAAGKKNFFMVKKKAAKLQILPFHDSSNIFPEKEQ